MVSRDAEVVEGGDMELQVLEQSDDITHVALIGKLDVQGLGEVDVRFQGATAARKKPTIVDLSQVDFIASLGMGMLIACAQALQLDGHPLVLVGATGDVETALRTAGLDQAMPMVDDVEAARSLIAAS